MGLGLHDETDAIKQYNAAVASCVAAGDNGTRQRFLKMIHEEEQHAEYLATQLELMGRLGLQNYLSGQMQGE